MSTNLLAQVGVPKVGRHPSSVVTDFTDGRNIIDKLKVARQQPVIWQPHLRTLQPGWRPGTNTQRGEHHFGASVGDLAMHELGLSVFNGRIFKAVTPTSRFTLVENFNSRPQLPAVRTLAVTDPGDTPASADALRDDLVANTIPSIEAGVTALANANPNLMLAGTNAANAGATFATTGGITLTTAATAADQMILAPHTGTNISAWAAAAWNSAKRILLETLLTPGASIANSLFWAGFKLTNPGPFALGTDDDQIIVWYDAAVDAYLHYTYSIAGTDYTGVLTYPSGTPIQVVASTPYALEIGVDEARQPYVIVNGVLALHGELSLRSLTTFKPSIGIQTASGAKAVTAGYEVVSMDY